MGASGEVAAEQGVGSGPMAGFGRERRLHARAYQHWAALLGGRAMPAITDLDPRDLAAFADHSVLIELTGTAHILFLGDALREQAGLAAERPALAEVPEGALLARLLERLPATIRDKAPVGFEGELGCPDGATLLHRGILLPFANEEGTMAAVWGVMNWKQVAARPAADIVAAVRSAFAMRPSPAPARPWGDGPAATIADGDTEHH